MGTGDIEDVDATVVPVGNASVAQNTGDAAQDGITDMILEAIGDTGGVSKRKT